MINILLLSLQCWIQCHIILDHGVPSPDCNSVRARVICYAVFSPTYLSVKGMYPFRFNVLPKAYFATPSRSCDIMVNSGIIAPGDNIAHLCLDAFVCERCKPAHWIASCLLHAYSVFATSRATHPVRSMSYMFVFSRVLQIFHPVVHVLIFGIHIWTQTSIFSLVCDNRKIISDGLCAKMHAR